MMNFVAEQKLEKRKVSSFQLANRRRGKAVAATVGVRQSIIP
jgi:hypothetical protein